MKKLISVSVLLLAALTCGAANPVNLPFFDTNAFALSLRINSTNAASGATNTLAGTNGPTLFSPLFLGTPRGRGDFLTNSSGSAFAPLNNPSFGGGISVSGGASVSSGILVDTIFATAGIQSVTTIQAIGGFIGDGSGLTGLNGSQVTIGTIPSAQLPLASSSVFGAVKVDGTTITSAGGVITAVGGSPPSTMLSVSTNITLNTVYTNGFGSAMNVFIPMSYTVAAVNGNANLSLVVLGFTNFTAGATTTVGVTIAMTYQDIISGNVPSGNGFYVTNTSTGVGNSAVMRGAVWSYATNVVGIAVYATNVISGGVLPIGTLTTASPSAGNFLGYNGTARTWTNLQTGDIPNLPGTIITSGTVADARLSANVPLLNGQDTWTGPSNIFQFPVWLNGGVTITNTPGVAALRANVGTNGFAAISAVGNFKAATNGTLTDVNFGLDNIKTNGFNVPGSNVVALVNNGTNVLMSSNGVVTIAGGLTTQQGQTNVGPFKPGLPINTVMMVGADGNLTNATLVNITVSGTTLTAAASGGSGGTNMVPTALTISGTNVALVGTLPTGAVGRINYKLTLTTNCFIQVPSGSPVDATDMRITLIQNATGTWPVYFDTNSAGGFKAGIDLQLPLPNTTNALARDIFQCTYDADSNKWLITGHVRGY